MDHGNFWSWIIWFHLAIMIVPALICAVKMEWDDFTSQPRTPSQTREVPLELSEHEPAA
jgi:hypothetical protein